MNWLTIISLGAGVLALSLIGTILTNLCIRRRDSVQIEPEKKWDLPEPGGDFRLYRCVKRLLDELEAERNEACLERDVAKKAYEEALAEQRRLAAKLDAAQDVLRTWMHPQMKIRA